MRIFNSILIFIGLAIIAYVIYQKECKPLNVPSLPTLCCNNDLPSEKLDNLVFNVDLDNKKPQPLHVNLCPDDGFVFTGAFFADTIQSFLVKIDSIHFEVLNLFPKGCKELVVSSITISDPPMSGKPPTSHVVTKNVKVSLKEKESKNADVFRYDVAASGQKLILKSDQKFEFDFHLEQENGGKVGCIEERKGEKNFGGKLCKALTYKQK